jgi:hypothetical protein
MVVRTVVLCEPYVGAHNFKSLPLLRSGCNEKVASIVLSCVTQLKLGLSMLFRVILYRLVCKSRNYTVNF